MTKVSFSLTVLSVDERKALFEPTLPSMVRFCKAFPPLIEDVTGLMLQYGRVCISEASLSHTASPKNVDLSIEEDLRGILSKEDSTSVLAARIQSVFSAILENSVLEKRTY